VRGGAVGSCPRSRPVPALMARWRGKWPIEARPAQLKAVGDWGGSRAPTLAPGVSNCSGSDHAW